MVWVSLLYLFTADLIHSILSYLGISHYLLLTCYKIQFIPVTIASKLYVAVQNFSQITVTKSVLTLRGSFIILLLNWKCGSHRDWYFMTTVMQSYISIPNPNVILTIWLALYYLIACWSTGISANNYCNTDKLGIEKDPSNLQPVVQHLRSKPSSPSIVLTLDVSASMEYQVCISTRHTLFCPELCQAFTVMRMSLVNNSETSDWCSWNSVRCHH